MAGGSGYKPTSPQLLSIKVDEGYENVFDVIEIKDGDEDGFKDAEIKNSDEYLSKDDVSSGDEEGLGEDESENGDQHDAEIEDKTEECDDDGSETATEFTYENEEDWSAPDGMPLAS